MTAPEQAGATAGTMEFGRPAAQDDPYLVVENLTVQFPTHDGIVQAVTDLSYTVRSGQTLGIVGESGSGKSVSSMAVLGLHNPQSTRLSGSIRVGGTEVIGADQQTLRSLRGNDAAMIFQDPLTALHPFYAVGKQIAEAARMHNDISKAEARRRAIDMLDRVGIPQASSRVDDYPHQFSGGRRQRAMIAMALVNNPQLLIADEPTTALDVTVQAQILDLLQDLQQEYGSAIVMITHDLGVIAEVADDVLVMYGGRAVETGPTKAILTLPEMPYTWGLLSSVPDITGATDVRLIPIPGTPPSLLNPPTGCSFHPRCPHVDKVPGELCRTTLPELTQATHPGHRKRCHLVNPDEIYLKEVLPEAAPDLIDEETGELIPELQVQLEEIQQETHDHPTKAPGRSAPRGGDHVRADPEKP
jgi:peptide/nickel transport system ATP-binding protein